jgi:cytochrome c biogenesis protein CcdA/thiol-disulfide isomerase/thioredoxin
MILIGITYLAGVLTILSPCILPVLPFVFSRAQKSFLKSGLPLLVGMSLTFTLFSALAVAGGEWISQASEYGRIIAMTLLGVFGLSLVFPSLSEKMLTPLTRLGAKIGQGSSGDSVQGSVLVGIGTGLLWAPCAGPILGLVLTGAAAQGDLSKSILLLVSYSLGAATSLGLALVAGNRFLGRLKKFLGVDQIVKKVLGVAVLLGVAAIALNLDRTILTQISKLETTSLENKLLSLIQTENTEEAIRGPLPELAGATAWINTQPLAKSDLKGKVVLIDFWTYSCINCLRTLPYVKTWYEKYKADGLVVVGIHSPEFAFEKSLTNVQAAVTDLGITYPVALDNDYEIWHAFSNRYWPAHYFVDRNGEIRAHHFGEGNYDESENTIRELLAENGHTLSADDSIQTQKSKISALPLSSGSRSPETYLGFDRAENFVSLTEKINDVPVDYLAASTLKPNQWTIQGQWVISEEKISLKKPKGKIKFQFLGKGLHLVLGSAKPVRFKVLLDGKAPGENHGLDIDKNGFGKVDSQRLYQLIQQKSDVNTDHLFEIEFLDEDVDAYAFTFG